MAATTTTARRQHPLLLAVLFSASFIAILDVFIVNVANPAIEADLHAPASFVQWIVAGYVLSYAVLLITAGRIGDAIGRRRTFRAGVALFTLASAGCGLAPTPTALVAARVIQGAGAALMQPQVLSILQVVFPPAERARCFAIMGAVIGVASVAGQIVGGALIALAGWRWIFLVNVPVGVAAVLLAGVAIPESRAPDARRIDVAGVALGTVTLLLVVVPGVEGREAGWPWWVFAALAAAVPAAVAWLAHERRLTARGGAPLVDLALFRVRSFRLGLGVVGLIWSVVPLNFVALAQYLQAGHGLTALESGLVLTPMALMFVTASFVAPRLPRALGRGAATTAVGGTAAAVLVLAAGGTLPAAALVSALAIMGTGQGLLMPGVIGAVLQRVPPTSAGSASGVLTTAQQTSNVLGIALGGTLFFAIAGVGDDPAAFGAAYATALGCTAAGAALAAVVARRLERPCEAGAHDDAVGRQRRGAPLAGEQLA